MKTIFILDNDTEQQKTIAQHLDAMGYGVRSFFSDLEFETVNEKPFAIIVDEEMAEKSGMLFLAVVVKKMSRVPVIYMTSKADKKLLSDAKKIGVFAVIEKNSAAFVHLRTTLDRVESHSTKTNWFIRLFTKKQSQKLPALSV